ncbi:hypothetical protein A3A66_02350 [Microgenomates group bacterium RIFCSPLOWO2_01_FULL_46_13]|nr:MAG: hypothetical protein A2783_00560 [Microgenomates group bacterium RIFCSPHIGHO2_01_FULL_45_11]OGV94814.1 MAG: hypothetical protein A3A66_02350 [Microgenomates group bacterium RIFCSPLOWO2_01_FULL_46_13]
MNLSYTPQAVKQIQKLPQAEKKKVIRKLELLVTDPKVGKPLKGELEGLYSLRAWPYRIIYKIKSSTIIIYSVAHRQSAYRK